MRRASSLPVVVQVGALAALAVIMSQAIAFAVVVLAPEPRPSGFSISTAARALRGEPAETADGRALRRRLTDRPVERSAADARDPLALAIRAGLANSLDVSPDRVAVTIKAPAGVRLAPPGLPRRRDAGDVAARDFIFVSRSENPVVPRPPKPPAPPTPGGRVSEEIRLPLPSHGHLAGPSPIVINETTRHFTLVADRLTFAPFSASLKLDDGRWATVEPPRGLLSPWQARVLLALAISMLLLAPLVWWMARRLTRPIRAFAEAAERLGADPEAPPLRPSGPSEVRTAIDAFNDMQASLRDHIRQRTQTVAAIAHDLRTPLTRLRFRAEQAPPEVRERMAADIEEMDALIGQAMAFVRGETTPERLEPLDLAALAADCAAGFAETGATVAFDGADALPTAGDPAALRRALANLIDNALKYGGGARVRAFAADDGAVVEVEDDGPGLPEAELEAVFEPFHRAERSRSRETGGAGLGLTIARQAARAAGGDVTLQNRTEGGLRARLVLPLAP
ncbi:MAG: HAMP domain-containing protein [Brevundimonas sp.]|uniref:ATP-binding protein n=1 Tax=Brevundimonas sp. TaxID=1871086 RepID=UPI0017F93984|nr:ATP-binding protein [Brevundimonas sp.]MBA4804940.1 HAMP domain-containing protein [Brevundimonas sp.]